MRTTPQDVLSRHGIRATRQRLQVLDALAAERNDATAQEIHERLRADGETIGLATVYRTLALLNDHGAIDAIAHRPGELCYRLCSEGHHHHLACSRCHRVIELEGCELDAWLGKLGRQHKFTVTSHTVEVTGVCADCRRSQ
jgi:Fur family ferric uptake transcriptional regulator